MKKALLTKLMLLLCALIAGSSSAWAGSITFSELGLENGVQYSDPFDGGDFTVTFGGGGNNGKYYTTGTGIRVYGDGTMTIAGKTANITSIVITYDGSNAPSSADVVDVGTYDPSTHTWTGNAASVVFTRPSGSGHWRVKSITVTTAGGGSTVSTPTISGNSLFLTSTDVTITCGTAGSAILYSTDDGANWNAYSAPFTLTETTTVKAKATKSGSTDSDIATKTFTKVTPITVTAALTAINALADGGTIADQCVSGIISKIDGYSGTYKSITYWISDDGTTVSQLEVYSGKGLNGADFSAVSDLNVGDEVTVFGTLKKYVKDDTTIPEFTQNSQLVSYSATGTPAPPTPVISASNVTIDSEATSGEITYSIENPTGASLSASLTEGDWISNVQVDAVNSKVTFSVTQNTGEQRIGKITLSYDGATNKDVKITQKATFGTATLPFAFDGGKADVETTAGLNHTGLGSNYSSSPKLKFDGTGDELVLKINDNPSILTFDIKGNSFADGTFTVQTSVDGVTYTDLKSYTELDAVSHEALDLASTVRYIKWVYTNKSAGNVAIGRIGVDCDAITIPEAGYITYSNATKGLSFAGVTAYKISYVGATSVALEEITEAPANTPVILNAAAGTYALGIVASAAAVTGNHLLVSDGNVTTDDANTVYALAAKGEPAVVGFYKVKAGVKVPAGKGYLSVAVTSAPEFLSFDGNDITGIKAIDNSQLTIDNVYNLNGQRVAQPTKGLYIVNGKKVIIK